MKHIYCLVILYGICLLPRLLFVLVVGETPLTLDEIEYDRLAWSLSEGLGYVSFFGLESTFRPPGYPLFLAGIYTVFGPDYYIARIVQAFFTSAIGPLTYLIGRKLISERSAIISGYVAGLLPTLILFSIGLMSENLFIPLLLLTLYLFIKLSENPSVGQGVLFGAALLCLIFTRSELSVVAILLLGWLVYSSHDKKLAIRNATIALAIVAIPVAAWSYRNYMITGEFVYLDSRAGINLHIAFNENSTGGFDSRSYAEVFDAYLKENRDRAAPNLSLEEAKSAFMSEWFAYKTRTIPTHSEVDSSKIVGEHWMHNYGKALALEYVTENPVEVIKLLPKKFMYFWDLDHRLMTFGYSNNVIGYVPPFWLTIIFIIVLTPFAAITVGALSFLSLSRWPSHAVTLLIPILFLTGIHTATFSLARYHYPISPLLVIFCFGLLGDIRLAPQPILKARIGLLVALLIIMISVWIIGLAEAFPRYAIIFGEGGNESRIEL